jgi:nicotinamide riboside transporter PnuC
MGLRAPLGHSRTPTNIMNFIQSIRASHLNRHGFIDVLVSAIVLQAIYIALIFSFSSPENDPIDTRTISVGHIVFSALIIAPYFENLLLIGLASLHEKLFNRTGLFVLAP